MNETITVLAWALIVAPLVNTYFVWRTLWRLVRNWHRFIWTLAVLDVGIWLLGLDLMVAAARFLVGLPALPTGGLILAVFLVGISAVPAFVEYQVSRVERG